jgi:D-amino peptidase
MKHQYHRLARAIIKTGCEEFPSNICRFLSFSNPKLNSFIPVLLLVVMSINPVIAQKKIYIFTDLEGVSGVYKFAQTREKDTPLNILACEYFMDDLSAVIRGLRAGGATEILVVDGHGSQCVIPHMMESGAKYLTGEPRQANMWGLDSSFVGLVQFGSHAMMGTPDGVLNHTQSSRSENRYWYNGVESGELVQCAAIAGKHGIPTILVTGDEATCRESKKFLGKNCVTVAVKDGISREAAILYPFKETRKALYEGAKKAMKALPDCKPYKMDMPIKGKMQYLDLRSDSTGHKIMTKEEIFDDVENILNF